MNTDRTNALETGLLIGDRWIADPKGGSLDHVNPATGKVQRAFANASADEVDMAVQAARDAFEEWRRWQPDARRQVLIRLAELLEEHSPRIATISSLETGSIYNAGNAQHAAAWYRYYAGWADKITGESFRPFPHEGLDFSVPEPVGVVGIFVTWNGPIGFCGMAGAPALAAGCCVVIKAPELAPFTTVTFGRLALEAGIPPGVVNVITGGPDAGAALVSHPGIDKISFTGGPATARKLQAAAGATLKPLVLELGGKSANIVFADADLDQAIRLSSRFTSSAGQGCSLPTRLLVERPIYAQVLDGVVDHAQSIVVGGPFDPRSQMGPVISASAADRILGMVAEATEVGGARLVAGGARLGGDLADGFFVQPTVLADVDPTARIAQEEVFGPVLCVIPFDTENEAVQIANNTQYGLAAYAQTGDISRARRLVHALKAGSVHINSSGPAMLGPGAPFGGIKQSGYGRQGSREGIAEFLSIKNVYINASPDLDRGTI